MGRKPEGGRRVLHGITQPFRLMSREAPLHETVGWEPNQSGQRGKDKKKKWKSPEPSCRGGVREPDRGDS